jgi:hypothetical protein
MTPDDSAGSIKGPRPRPAAQRVFARITITETGYGTPCWLFQGALTSTGYGNVGSRVDDRAVFEGAHRSVFAAAYGPIPEGLHLDHLCSNRRCVNPGHLEAVSPYENNRRQQMRRRGAVTSWLASAQRHVFGAQLADDVALVSAMRLTGVQSHEADAESSQAVAVRL